jgi:hypothetical protein
MGTAARASVKHAAQVVDDSVRAREAALQQAADEVGVQRRGYHVGVDVRCLLLLALVAMCWGGGAGRH